jgi:hypothetical protein
LIMAETRTSAMRRREKRIAIDQLRSPSFDVVELYKNHQAVSKALSLDFDAIICLAKALPLGLRGREHREMRKELATVLAEGKRQLQPRLPELVKKHFKLLTKAGHHDLLADVCRPFVNECMELLSGLALKPEQFDNLSDIFDPGAGVAKRRRLEVTTQNLLKSASETAGDRGLYGIAVAVMGRDALLASLVFSLHRHFSQLQGREIGSSCFSRVPQDTAIPYVWRVGVDKGNDGDVFECCLNELIGSDDDERMKLFGAGQHTCLGKSHTLQIFETLSEFLSDQKGIVASVKTASIDMHVLKIPEYFEIELR